MKECEEVSATRAADFVAHVDRTLRSAGRRVTKPRLLVAECLGNGIGKLWTAYSITKQVVATGSAIDTVSIYRIFKVFVELQLIKAVVVDFHTTYIVVESGEYYGDAVLVHDALHEIMPIKNKLEIRELARDLCAEIEEHYPNSRVTITVNVTNVSPRYLE